MTRRVEDIAENLEFQLQSEVGSFDFFPLALDESCDVRDTAQLLIFLRGITRDFKLTEELAAMRPMKGTTTGSDLFTEVNACMDKLGLEWDRLALPFCFRDRAPILSTFGKVVLASPNDHSYLYMCVVPFLPYHLSFSK